MATLGELLTDPSWRELLSAELAGEPFARLSAFVERAYADGVVHPDRAHVFEAFNRTPVDRVRVVILGQDPYHNPGQAHGLCFSVPAGTDLPPSLRNIYKELDAEYGGGFSGRGGDLSHWADQGVLMLNATLTVADGADMALSHQGRGWEAFTDAAIRALAARRDGLVYMLWGAYAQKKASFVDAARNLVLASAHPSPLSARRGFFGCNHFRLCNDYLAARGQTPIQW